MPPQDWTRIFSASVVPVAIISACALLCLALYNRLASMISRLRGFHRERLREYKEFSARRRAGQEDPLIARHHQYLLKMLEVQTRRVYRRARIMRWSILALLAAIASLTLCSLTTGLSLLMPGLNGVARLTAEGLFLGGMLLMFAGVFLAILEMWNALEPVQLESEFVGDLVNELDAEMFKDESALPVNGHGQVMEKD